MGILMQLRDAPNVSQNAMGNTLVRFGHDSGPFGTGFDARCEWKAIKRGDPGLLSFLTAVGPYFSLTPSREVGSDCKVNKGQQSL